MHAKEAPPFNQLPDNDKHYALFTDGSCCGLGTHQKQKTAMWSPAKRVAEVVREKAL